MKRFNIFILTLLASSLCMAETKYINAKIDRVEMCKNSGGAVFIFFKDVSGAQPNTTNGCSNETVLPYVELTSERGVFTDLENAMFSTVLAAKATDSEVRVRFDNETNLLVSIAIK